MASLPGSRPHGNPLLAAGKGAGEEERVPVTHRVSAEVSMSFSLTFHWCELSRGQTLPPKEAGDVVPGYVVLHPVKLAVVGRSCYQRGGRWILGATYRALAPLFSPRPLPARWPVVKRTVRRCAMAWGHR